MGLTSHHHRGKYLTTFVSFESLSEIEMAEETETKAVKRGRGRPPKPDSEKKTKVVKNDEASDDGEPPVKRGRGRPKGSTKSKGRGRPKGQRKWRRRRRRSPQCRVEDGDGPRRMSLLRKKRMKMKRTRRRRKMKTRRGRMRVPARCRDDCLVSVYISGT